MLAERLEPARGGLRPRRRLGGVEAVLTVHITVGVAVIATSLAAGIWGGVAWLRDRPSVGFWYALRVEQVAVVLQATLGAILLLSGQRGGQRASLRVRRSPVAHLAVGRGGARGSGRARADRTGLRIAPARAPATHCAGDRPARDRDHGRVGSGRLRARGPGRHYGVEAAPSSRGWVGAAGSIHAGADWSPIRW